MKVGDIVRMVLPGSPSMIVSYTWEDGVKAHWFANDILQEAEFLMADVRVVSEVEDLDARIGHLTCQLNNVGLQLHHLWTDMGLAPNVRQGMDTLRERVDTIRRRLGE
jgi:uncharacterized protein YodC (DUF2158 family)